MIPRGYRIVDSNEVIKDGFKRWLPKAGTLRSVVSAIIGMEIKQARMLGYIGSASYILEYMGDYPEFEGWYPIGSDLPCKTGDRAICQKHVVKGGSYNHPDKGLIMTDGITLKQHYPGDSVVQSGDWCVYRKIPGTTSSIAAPRRVMEMNPHFSKPLPLP